MTNQKSTKRALVTSVVALFLCFTMLLGTTYAWFTDSVASKNNVIKSGNLDVTLEYKKVVNGKISEKWETVEGKDDIFNPEALWEPGYTEVVYLKLKNAGSLAFKYQLGVNVTETPGVNVYGEEFLLSDYIYFDVIEGVNADENAYASREEAMEDATENTLISKGYNKSSALLSQDEVYLALIVHMPTTVENDANHNGVDIPEINLGISLFATQYAYEKDSYNEYYDGAAAIWTGDIDTAWYDASATELTIGNADQLAGLAVLVNGNFENSTTYSLRSNTQPVDFAGQTITLASDVDLKNLPWTPIGTFDYPFAGNFDGNGHTISNLNIDTPTLDGVGFFGVTQNSIIENITFKNVKVVGNSMVAAIDGAAYPSVFSNCHVTGDINIFANYAYAAGIAAYCYYGVQVSDCSVIADDMGSITTKDRNAVGGIVSWLKEGDHKITNCEVKNLNLTGWANIGGITGLVAYGNTIDGCSVENLVITKTRADGRASVGMLSGGYDCNEKAVATLTNNSAKNITFNGSYVAAENTDLLYGSSYGNETYTNFVLDNNTQEGIVNNLVEVTAAKTADALVEALEKGEDVVLTSNIKIDPAGMSNAYGKTGINVKNGQTIDGNGFVLDIKGAGGTWDSGINTTGGLIKNIKVTGSFRGIFINHNSTHSEKVVLENVIIEGTTYTISCDQGTYQGLKATNSTFNGWTSYAATLGNAEFINCQFGFGNGYRFMRPYAPTTFVGCNFEAGYQMDPRAAVSFENCTLDGKPLTTENIATLVTSRIENVTINGTTVVTTGEALKAALTADEKKISVMLAKDMSIDISTGLKLGGAETESITIISNGKTLTLSNTYRSYFNLANPEGTLYLENLTLTNLHKGTHFFDYTTHFNCDVVAKNVTFAKSPLISSDVTAVFTDCNFAQAGTDIYGLWIMSGSNVTVNGGELTTDRGFKISDEDSADEKTILNVSNTKFNNTKKAAVLVTTNFGAEITLNNLDISNCASDSTNAIWIDDGRTATADKIIVTGATVVIEP